MGPLGRRKVGRGDMFEHVRLQNFFHESGYRAADRCHLLQHEGAIGAFAQAALYGGELPANAADTGGEFGRAWR